MLQEKFLFSYSKLTLLALAFLYFMMPLGLQYIVGEDFYIFSKYQFLVSDRSFIFYLLLVIFLTLLVKFSQKETVSFNRLPSRQIFNIFYLINISYLLIILIRGVFLRRQGASRDELLSIISSQLIPGYGYILLLACIAIIHLKSKKHLILFIIVAFSVDILYQGKIFATVSLILLMFFIDNMKAKFSYLRLLLIGLCGFGFLTLIFVIRAFAKDGQDSDFVGVYTFFSEFMGVQATTGWSYGYHLANLPGSFSDFDLALQKYYVSSVGHGLAISPVAYFTGNFGDFYLVASITFFFILFMIFYYSSKLLGRYTLFVLGYNFIHLLRHGPNVFLHNCILQLSFLIVVVFLIKSFGPENAKVDLEVR